MVLTRYLNPVGDKMDNPNIDPFDFNDLSDLPADMQEKLTVATNGSVDELVAVIAKGKDKGFDALSLNQTKAAGMRMGIEMPTDATIRNWLNTGVMQQKLEKASRQTYSIAGTNEAPYAIGRGGKIVVLGEGEAAPVSAGTAAPADDEHDPLADLD